MERAEEIRKVKYEDANDASSILKTRIMGCIFAEIHLNPA